MKLICVECIVDHSGHHFVRKEESVYVLRESAQSIASKLESMTNQTEALMQSANDIHNEMRLKRIKDLKIIDSKYQRLLDKISAQRAQIKVKYNECFKIEERRIQTELENFEKHASLINFNRDTVLKAVEELDSGSI